MLKVKKQNLSLQKGDVVKTHSDISLIKKYINYKPSSDILDGIDKFIEWYKEYYKIT